MFGAQGSRFSGGISVPAPRQNFSKLELLGPGPRTSNKGRPDVVLDIKDGPLICSKQTLYPRIDPGVSGLIYHLLRLPLLPAICLIAVCIRNGNSSSSRSSNYTTQSNCSHKEAIYAMMLKAIPTPTSPPAQPLSTTFEPLQLGLDRLGKCAIPAQ